MYLSFCDIFVTSCFRSNISFFHTSSSQQIGMSPRANVSNELVLPWLGKLCEDKAKWAIDPSEMKEG